VSLPQCHRPGDRGNFSSSRPTSSPITPSGQAETKSGQSRSSTNAPIRCHQSRPGQEDHRTEHECLSSTALATAGQRNDAMASDDHDLHWTVSRGVDTHVSPDAREPPAGPAAADAPVPPERASTARIEGINRVIKDVGRRACGFRNPTNHSRRVRPRTAPMILSRGG
jgi:hypothetical protein